MTSRRYDVSRILEAKEAAGGWNELAKLSKINRGTLKYVGEGKRNPSPKLAERLLKVGLIEPVRRAPREKPVPWRRIAVHLAPSEWHLTVALMQCGIDQDKAQALAERWKGSYQPE